MDMTEDMVFDALGVQPQSAEGVNEGQPADVPATAPNPPGSGEGENQPESARPAEDQGTSPASDSSTGEASPGETPTGNANGNGQTGQNSQSSQSSQSPQTPGKPAPQSPEERARFAAERRRQETQVAINAAVERALGEERARARQRQLEFFQRAQLTNTITGSPITSMDEFDQWHQQYSAAKLEQDLKDGKLTPEHLKQVVEDSPSMRAARDLIQRDRLQQSQARQEQARERIRAELEDIQKLDPGVRSVEDILKMDTGKQFYELVRGGKSFSEAFRLANFDRLMDRTARAAAGAGLRQAGQAGGKDHLIPASATRGGGAVSVPREDMELFHALNPGASERDIQAYYNSYRGNRP